MGGIAKLQLLIDIKEKLNVGLNTAKQKVSKATGEIQRKLDSIGVNTAKIFDAIKSQIPFVGEAIAMLANPYTLVATVALAAATGIGIATSKAIDWKNQLAEINVTAEKNSKQLDSLSDKLLDIGGNNVLPLQEVPKAFNSILSAINDTDLSLAALEPTLRAAKAGFSDTETAAAAMTRIMGATGIKDATRIYDVLFATMKSGNSAFADIANYMPKIIPGAQNLGFAFEEVAGSYANLTKSLNPEAAATALQNIFTSLGRKDTVQKFSKMGINIFDDKGKARPLIAIFEDLNKKMAGLTDKQKMLKFGSLGLDTESARGFSLLSRDIPQIKKDIDEVTGSQGALNKAYSDAKSPLDSWKIAMNQITVQIIQVGQLFIPIVEAIGRGVLFLTQNLDIIGGVLAGLAIAWSILNAQLIAQTAATLALKTATGIATIAQWAFNVAANANPIGLIVLAIGALIGGLVVAYKKFDGFRAVIQGSWETIKGFGKILKEFVLDKIKQLLSGLGSIGKAIKLLFDGDFNSAWSEAKKGVIEISNSNALDRAVNKTRGLDKTFAKTYGKVMLDAQNKKLKEKTTTNNEKKGTPTIPIGETPPITPPGGNGTGGIASDAQGIKGGSQTKNITINIDSFIKGGLNPQHTSINSMNKDELEKWLTEMFFRVIRSAETSV